MRTNLVHVGTLSRAYDRVRGAVSTLGHADPFDLVLAVGAVFTMAWISFVIWTAYKLLQLPFS